ncbi:MAG: hypothetical protein KY468_12855 [Armatimonadetes bacterium]|nr:hypothetical protein [Armatimonadota bacterium]
MSSGWIMLVFGAILLAQAIPASALTPKYRETERGLILERVSPNNPMIYDNDWWKDVPDAAYLWSKASMGQADLRGNIVSRDMWGWKEGYTYKLDQGMKDARALLEAARKSGLKKIPDPIPGANEALVKPESGKIEETKFTRSPGSDLIVAEAKKASPKRPLLVYAGGPSTTVAAAYLTDPSIADRVIVFQIDGGAYNGKDSWSWEIMKQRLPFANWARGYFWGDWSGWNPDRFKALPKNPLGDVMREYAHSDLGKANQWGDGAWIFATFAPRSITKAESYDNVAITVPKAGTNVKAMEAEFFATMTNPKVYGNTPKGEAK